MANIDISQPMGYISPQILTDGPITGGQTCLVDDPVHIVDDPGILTGSRQTPVADIRLKAQTNAPGAYIKQLR